MWRVDAAGVVRRVDVTETRTERLLLVGPVGALCERSTEHPRTLVGVELQRSPRDAVVDALVQRQRVIRSTRSTELHTDVRHLREHPTLQIALIELSITATLTVCAAGRQYQKTEFHYCSTDF